jgi:tetratricopeptide (TPR) repeat protein
MASNSPVIKQIAWISLLVQLPFMALLIFLSYIAGIKEFLICGAGAYLVLSFLLKRILSRHHRQGIVLCRLGKYHDAIEAYERSYNYFSEHSWIDRWRYLTLLCSSRISYREMALFNMAGIYTQIGQGAKAIEIYEQILKEFPDSGIANTIRDFISSIKTSA